ncbi:DUF1015 family protein [Clostridiaceae bacterium 35-E11]
MAIIKPFKGIRPAPKLAAKVSSLPYDVMNREEAKKMAHNNPYSFLHVGRSEIDLDDCIDAYDKKVYEKAQDNLTKMIEQEILIQDEKPLYYIYRQIMDGRTQTGIVGCTSIDDYMNDIIKKHEFTRTEKEQDRINHFDHCNANTEPIFLTYRTSITINNILNSWIEANQPIYEFTSDDHITHIVWVIDSENIIRTITEAFADIQYLYIADGHHRAASAVKVGLKRRETNPDFLGTEEFNYFLSVLFADDDLFVMDYNRVVKDLNGLTIQAFLDKVSEHFKIEIHKDSGAYRPTKKHTFGMFLNETWYTLTTKKGSYKENDPMDQLDVSILQNNLLQPVLGIQDPRTDKRIDFVGGIRGLAELERRVKSDMKVAFSLYPPTMDDLFSIADAGKVMPPKSTWFEPKLRSGLFIHSLSE